MSKVAGAMVLLLGCSSAGEPRERLPPPEPSGQRLTPPAVPAPLPPPPPPPLPSSQPPPTEIATFLREHAADTSAWRATVYELANEPSRRSAGFCGHPIVKQTTLGEADAAELAAQLGRDASYTTGDYGCFLDRSSGYRLMRGPATLEFMVNCGHVSFDGADWHAAILSTDMIERLDRLGRAPR